MSMLYTPGKSFLHKADPISKLTWMIAVLIFCFINMNPLILSMVFLISLILAALAGKAVLKRFFSSMAILLPIILTLIYVQSFFPAVPQPWLEVFRLGPLTAKREGLYYGLVFATRVLSVASFCVLMIMVTHPADLFSALRRLGLPHNFAFMTLVTIQLIPIMQRELGIIASAQRSRGLKLAGLKALFPSLTPLFAVSFERVSTMAMTLEARGFGGKGKRTVFREVKTTTFDWVASAAAIAFIFASTYWQLFMGGKMDWMRTLMFPPLVAEAISLGSILGFIISIVYYLVKLVR